MQIIERSAVIKAVEPWLRPATLGAHISRVIAILATVYFKILLIKHLQSIRAPPVVTGLTGRDVQHSG